MVDAQSIQTAVAIEELQTILSSQVEIWNARAVLAQKRRQIDTACVLVPFTIVVGGIFITPLEWIFLYWIAGFAVTALLFTVGGGMKSVLKPPYDKYTSAIESFEQRRIDLQEAHIKSVLSGKDEVALAILERLETRDTPTATLMEVGELTPEAHDAVMDILRTAGILESQFNRKIPGLTSHRLTSEGAEFLALYRTEVPLPTSSQGIASIPLEALESTGGLLYEDA